MKSPLRPVQQLPLPGAGKGSRRAMTERAGGTPVSSIFTGFTGVGGVSGAKEGSAVNERISE